MGDAPRGDDRERAGAYPRPIGANHSRDGRRAILAAVAVAAVAAAGALRRVHRFEVVGASMLPALQPGDRVLVWRGARPRWGDVVAVRDPRVPERMMLKRVAAAPGGRAAGPGGEILIAGTGYIVLGDNAGSTTDSTNFGPVAPKDIKGRAFYRYAPASRRGRLVTSR